MLFAAMFALGVALISTVRNSSVDLTHFMFGNVLGVSPADLRLTAILGGAVVLLVIAFYKEFLVISFDPVLAAILRLPAQFFRYLLLVMLAVTVVIALQTVGVGLMVAMLITPPGRLAAHPPPADDDGRCGADRRGLRCDRPLPLVLRQRGVGRGDRAGVYRFFPAGALLRATRGIVWRYTRNHSRPG